MFRNGFLIGAAAAGLASVAIVGCGGSNPDGAHPAAPTASSAARGDVAPVATVQAALRTAAQAVPNGRPFDVEIETSGNQAQFDVKVASDGAEWKVEVDSAGTRVLSQQKAAKPSDDAAKLGKARVDAGKALDAAAQKEPGANFKEMEIDSAATTVIWQVELVRSDGAEIEYGVDANSGAVLGTGLG